VADTLSSLVRPHALEVSDTSILRKCASLCIPGGDEEGDVFQMCLHLKKQLENMKSEVVIFPIQEIERPVLEHPVVYPTETCSNFKFIPAEVSEAPPAEGSSDATSSEEAQSQDGETKASEDSTQEPLDAIEALLKSDPTPDAAEGKAQEHKDEL
jgi:hypothetical protein